MLVNQPIRLKAGEPRGVTLKDQLLSLPYSTAQVAKPPAVGLTFCQTADMGSTSSAGCGIRDAEEGSLDEEVADLSSLSTFAFSSLTDQSARDASSASLS